jgi:hypothetical protein
MQKTLVMKTAIKNYWDDQGYKPVAIIGVIIFVIASLLV